MSRLFVLLAAICGWLAIACSDSGSSDGSGGSVGGNGGGGGPSTMLPNPDGTCESGYALQQKADEPDMVCIKTNDGNGGSSGAGGNGGGGSSGSAGDTPPIADIGTTSPDTGFGGSGGGPSDAAPQVEQCPYWEDITDDRDPCILAGQWTEMTNNGRAKVTVTKTSSTMCTVVLEGEDIIFEGIFTGEILPLQLKIDFDGQLNTLTLDIDNEGHMIFDRLVDGNQSGQEKFFRNN